MLLIFCFLCNLLSTIICLFVLFLLAIAFFPSIYNLLLLTPLCIYKPVFLPMLPNLQTCLSPNVAQSSTLSFSQCCPIFKPFFLPMLPNLQTFLSPNVAQSSNLSFSQCCPIFKPFFLPMLPNLQTFLSPNVAQSSNLSFSQCCPIFKPFFLPMLPNLQNCLSPNVAQSSVFCVVLCGPFSFCLFSFDLLIVFFFLHLLITTPLVSPNTFLPLILLNDPIIQFNPWPFVSIFKPGREFLFLYFVVFLQFKKWEVHCSCLLLFFVILVELLILVIRFKPFNLLLPKCVKKFGFSHLSILIVPDNGYYRNASCALN